MNFQIINKRKIVFILSAIFIIISSFFLIFGKYNYGIDMTGGTQTEYIYEENNLNIDQINKDLQEIKKDFSQINTIGAYKVTGENKIIIETGFEKNKQDENFENQKITIRDKVTEIIKNSYPSIKQNNYVNIGASFGDYIKDTALLTLIIAAIGTTIYVAYAFSGTISGISSVSFGVITILTLIFDVIGSAGLYIGISQVISEYKIDTFFVTALLTIIGYSINDTIVIFDRIRSNLREFGGKTKNLEEIIDMSLSQVMRRSIYMSITMIIVLFVVFFVGPESIRGFVLVMMFGTIIGTYSSIFLASPLLYEINKEKKLEEYKEQILSDEDKIVV